VSSANPSNAYSVRLRTSKPRSIKPQNCAFKPFNNRENLWCGNMLNESLDSENQQTTPLNEQ
jgi:hypothetical protein